jgi:outer membrane protein OmpA-like peptidoglycan-associated protein
MMKSSNFLQSGFRLLIFAPMVLSSGCIATQDWVQTFVKEQILPVEKRVSETEAGMTKTNARVSGLESRVETMANQIANLDSRVNQTNAKADQALENLQKLKVERKLVLDMKQGAFFTTNSTVLTNQAKTEIESFLSDVIGQSGGPGNLFFVVAGHTDNAGSEKYNFDLARIRAENTASYLAT